MWQPPSIYYFTTDPLENGIRLAVLELVGIAHIRLELKMSSHHLLRTLVPQLICDAILKLPYPRSRDGLIAAVQYSGHHLSLFVRAGLRFPLTSQQNFRILESCICRMEFAVFLSKWLLAIAETGLDRSRNCMYFLNFPTLGSSQLKLVPSSYSSHYALR
jgi:hypothetical protein